MANPPGEKHVAVFAFPFASHPRLLLTLVRRLALAAPNVVFSFFSTKKSNQTLFSDNTYEHIVPCDVSDGVPEGYIFAGNREEYINLFVAVAEEELRRGVKTAEEGVGMKVSCLVVDAFLWFAADMADQMGIPWVSFRTGGTASLAAHFYTDLIREKCAQLNGSGSAGPDDEIPDLIPGLPAIRLGDLPGGIVFGDLESPFATMLHKMGRNLARATAVPINSFQELDPDLTKNLSSKFNLFLNIGPSNLIPKQNPQPKSSDEFSCIPWLATQKPRSVAYVSFGTICKLPPHEVLAVAESLDQTNTPFLWSINHDSMKHFPDGFLEKTRENGIGKVVTWAPQVEVLKHSAVGVFVTHCGWNSVSESVGAGVPMICRPFFGDQQINAWMVSRVWGIGVRIEGGSFTTRGTSCALELVLSNENESSKTMNEKIEALKEAAHKAVEPNGSSDRNFKTLVDVVTGATMSSTTLEHYHELN